MIAVSQSTIGSRRSTEDCRLMTVDCLPTSYRRLSILDDVIPHLAAALHDRGHVLREQVAVLDESSAASRTTRRYSLLEDFSAPPPRPRIAGCLARARVSPGTGMDEPVSDTSSLVPADRGAAEIPAGVGRERHGDVWQADAGDLVSIGVDLADEQRQRRARDRGPGMTICGDCTPGIARERGSRRRRRSSSSLHLNCGCWLGGGRDAVADPPRHRDEQRPHRPRVIHRVVGLLRRRRLARRELSPASAASRRTDRRGRCRAAAGSLRPSSDEWIERRRAAAAPVLDGRIRVEHLRRVPARPCLFEQAVGLPLIGSRGAASANGKHRRA